MKRSLLWSLAAHEASPVGDGNDLDSSQSVNQSVELQADRRGRPFMFSYPVSYPDVVRPSPGCSCGEVFHLYRSVISRICNYYQTLTLVTKVLIIDSLKTIK